MVFFCGRRSVINEALLMLSLIRRCEREEVKEMDETHMKANPANSSRYSR